MMENCRWCGLAHSHGICPKVKAIEFEGDGVTVKRVEFMTPRDCMPANGWPPVAYWPAIGSQPLLQSFAPDIQTTLQNQAQRPFQ